MFKRLLIPLDGSNLAESVLPYSIFLAKQINATLILFHVVENKAPEEIHGQPHIQTISEANDYLDKIIVKYSDSEVNLLKDVHEVQEVGVAQTIRDHGEELHADMIVLCAHGKGGLRDLIFGSIAQQVIKQDSVPVLFIRPEILTSEGVSPIQNILIPLDGDKSHQIALPAAAHLAKKFHAKVHFLTVIPYTETLSMKEAITSRISPRTSSLSLDTDAKHAEEYLHGLCQQLSRQGLETSKIVLRGDVLSNLLITLQNEQIDLLVMATHGHNVIDARWEGSLTPRFLPKSPVPVLLVRGTKTLS